MILFSFFNPRPCPLASPEEEKGHQVEMRRGPASEAASRAGRVTHTDTRSFPQRPQCHRREPVPSVHRPDTLRRAQAPPLVTLR